MFNEIGTQRADPESFFIITHFTPKTRESQKIAIKTMKNSFAHIFSTLIKINNHLLITKIVSYFVVFSSGGLQGLVWSRLVNLNFVTVAQKVLDFIFVKMQPNRLEQAQLVLWLRKQLSLELFKEFFRGSLETLWLTLD